MIVGHGIDLIEIQQVGRRLSTSHGEWLDGAFTEAEQAQADPEPHWVQYFAGRYAAKP
jgi:phosphopantetheinyl transferase (holo-ACP synthase)